LTLHQFPNQAKIVCHGAKLNQPDWGADAHFIGLPPRSGFLKHRTIDAYREPLDFDVPPVAELSGHDLKPWIDASRESPDDMCFWDEAAVIREAVYPLQPHSGVVLFSRIKIKW